MADISTELQAIRDAVYGEEVRGSIVTALDKMNEIDETAEAYAVGTRNGAPVPSSDPAYDNNAKYYAEQAAESAAAFVVDPTLTESGEAADAKVTGEVKDFVTSETVMDDVIINGGIHSGTGADAPGSNRVATAHSFPQSRFLSVRSKTGYEFIVYAYDENDDYVGSYRSGTYEKTSGAEALTEFYFGNQPSNYRFRLVLRPTVSVTSMNVSERVNLLFRLSPVEMSLKHYSATAAFGVSDMPRNSFAFVSPSLFSDCPTELTSALENIYIERRNMDQDGNVSMVTVVDQANLENRFIAVFTEPDTLRTWVRMSGASDLTEGYRSDTLSKSAFGVDFEWDAERNVYHVEGTRDGGIAFYNLTRNIPTSGGKVYYALFDHETDDIFIQFYGHDGTNLTQIGTDFTGRSRRIVIPSGTIRFYYRVVTKDGVAVDEDFNVYVTEGIDATILNELAVTANSNALPSCDLDDLLVECSLWLLADNYVYDHVPNDATTGFLSVYRFSNWTLQIFYNLSATKMWLRRANASGTWTEWTELSGSGGGGTVINNEYVFNSYNQTFNASVSPRITTDRNQYLETTGDTTDVKASIEALLNDTGVCRLGPGDFYVSGVNMPERSMLIGSGKKTRLILLGGMTDEGYAIHLSSYCTVRDMSIMGSTTSFPYPTEYSYVNRHGILFEANWSSDESTKKRCVVDGCEIRSFSGGGITCYNTGYPVDSTLMVSNTVIMFCQVGINIPYWSEFNIFTAVRCSQNYYGCVNNGGNNLFTACNFSSNRVGMLLDNSQGQSPNNTHGSVVGCIFDHSDGNTGVGIKMDGCRAGQIFSDCQLFYSSIEVSNSSGVVFSHFNIGGTGNHITLTEGEQGGAIIFDACMFKVDSTTISVSSGYDKVHFINCYDRDGVAVTAG